MEKLDILRQEIDNIDKELVDLFEKRMKVVLKVAEYKKEKGIPVLNSSREEQVVKKNTEHLKNPKFTNASEAFLKTIMEESRKLQSQQLFDYNGPEKESTIKNLDYAKKKYIGKECREKLNVGFQGVPGSFGEEALLEYFGDSVNAYSFNEFKDVFTALQDGSINYGVLPVENSSTGGITEVYNLLRKHGFYIVGEKCIKIPQHLMGIKGASINDIKEVYSHPQAFEQCSIFLNNYPQWKIIPYYNTAKSAKLVSDFNLKSTAAIGSRKAAKLYNLDIIKEDINFNSSNYTRFIVVGKQLEIDEDNDKISIIISLPHKTGSLYNILKNFAENNLNLLKIESRPIQGRTWEYFFYIDFQGNMAEEYIRKAVQVIEEKCNYFKILGNYKADCTLQDEEKGEE